MQDGTTSQKGVVQLAGSIGATVASENNKAASEKAVRDAINAMNAETTDNKVTSFQSTPDNTHYPSEKLVKDSLDAKAESNNSVAIYDGYVRRMAEVNGWNKIASKTYTRTNRNVNTLFRLYGIGNIQPFVGELFINIRFGASGSAPVIIANKVIFNKNTSTNIKLKITGTSGNAIVEIWVQPTNYTLLYCSCLENGEDVEPLYKDWTFSKTLTADKDEPVADTSNNIYVFDSTKKYVQYDIDSPTNDNLVAMDASGLVKDSGIGSGTLSTALTKLDGIAAGAEVNVQADWDATSGDAAILNKPFRKKYTGNTAYYKVCTLNKSTVDSTEIYGIEIAARQYIGGVYGTLIYKDKLRLFLNKVSSVNVDNHRIKLYSLVGDSNVTIYASAKGYVTLEVAPLINLSKSHVNFTDFGTEVSALPEGATEITPVWVANSDSSSGTAPVKVDAYGALTPVPMDSTPTASSTNLMTSGDIKTALDNIVVDANERYPFGVRQTRTASYGYKLFNVKFSTAQSATRIRVSGNLVVGVGTSGHTERISFDLIILNTNAAESNPSNIYLNTTSTRRSSRVARLAYKAPTNWSDGLDVYLLWSEDGATSSSNYAYGWEIVLQEATTSSVEVKDENLTSALTGFTLDYTRTSALIEGTSAVGSSGTPVYVTADGVVTACTDDFEHTTNKVTSIRSSASATNTAYPSELAVRSELNAKNNLHAIRLTSENDLNAITNVYSDGSLLVYNWINTSVPDHAPDSIATMVQYGLANGSVQNNNCVQIAYPRSSEYYYERICNAGTWSDWKKVYYEATSTYSSTGTAPVNGTAVAAALGTLDVTDTAVSHQFVTAVSETDGKVSITRAQPVISDVDGLQTALDGKEGSITWMTEQEARSIWANAKAAVAAS